MTREEKLVVEFLNQSLTLNLEVLDTINDQKTPDFITTLDGKKYLLELKSSFESDEAVEAKKLAFEQDEIYRKHEVIGPTNKNSRNFNNAYKQLKNRKDSESAEYCLYIINLTNTDSSYQEQTVFANLLGAANVLTDGECSTCLYYHESEFFKRRDLIDGAIIVAMNSNPVLVLNDYSENYLPLKASSLASLFDEVYDPVLMEKNPGVISVREGIDRKDRAALRSYLEKKYGFEFAIQVPFQYFSTSAIIK